MTYAQAVIWCRTYPRAINEARAAGSEEASILCRYFSRSCNVPDSYPDYSEAEVATAATDLQSILGATTYPDPS